MEYITEITLDVDLHKELPTVRVKQGDASVRKLLINLKKNGSTFTPDSGGWILFRCEKPDGHAVLLDSRYEDSELNRYLVIDNRDGTVSVELVAQVTAVYGSCRCDICLVKGSNILSTIPFVIDVRRSPNTANLAVSSDDFRTLVNELDRLEELIPLIDTSVQSTTTLTLSTSWTGSSSPYTQTVNVVGYTVSSNTKVDLYADSTVINSMVSSGTNTIMVINNNGTLTAYAIGGKPTSALTVQACIYETAPL